MHIFCTVACPARPVAGRFSRSRLRGTQGGRMYTKAQVWGPGRAPWRVLWAFEVAQSGKQSQGRFPSSQSLARQWKSRISAFRLLLCGCCCIMSVSHHPSRSQALYFVAATAQQQSHIKLLPS